MTSVTNDQVEQNEIVCEDCGRTKAKSAMDMALGHCPKWYAVRDEDADRDCRRTAAGNRMARAKELLEEMVEYKDDLASLMAVSYMKHHGHIESDETYESEGCNEWELERIFEEVNRVFIDLEVFTAILDGDIVMVPYEVESSDGVSIGYTLTEKGMKKGKALAEALGFESGEE